ncbi:hypothetical protein [Pseudorhodoplanes sp.]|uniref:hypothetical protein n=1 Tax=Pseudorhodoplanes sp. TaxID=1934341 RepID=UPI00391D5043
MTKTGPSKTGPSKTGPSKTGPSKTGPSKTERSAAGRYARHDWQTPEQHAKGLAIRRQHDAMRLHLCRLFETWRSCAVPQCRREGDCTGDMHACFLRVWSNVGEDDRAWFRAFVTARSGRNDTQAAATAAEDAVARDRMLSPRADAPAAHAETPAPPQPETQTPVAMPRIRAL